MAHNQWYHFGIGAPPILAYFSGDWDVHWGVTGVLTHGHLKIPNVGFTFKKGHDPSSALLGYQEVALI